MPLRTRQPTGLAPWPLILLAGEEKSGKSYAAAAFAADERLGRRFWLDLGEGAADEYAALGQRTADGTYEIVEHDGTYSDILDQILAVAAVARASAAAGEPPVLLVVDSMTALWRSLTGWTQSRATRSKKAQAILAADPDAEIDIPMNLWNDANQRHRRVVDVLMTMPAVVVATARLAERTVIVGGRPKPTGEKEWKAETQKDLPYDATVVLHAHRDPRSFFLAGARSLTVAQPDGDPVLIGKGTLDLGTLVFDRLGCATGTTPARPPVTLVADPASAWLDEVAGVTDVDELRKVWKRAGQTLPPGPDLAQVLRAITARAEHLQAAAPPKPLDDTLPTGDDLAGVVELTTDTDPVPVDAATRIARVAAADAASPALGRRTRTTRTA